MRVYSLVANPGPASERYDRYIYAGFRVQGNSLQQMRGVGGDGDGREAQIYVLLIAQLPLAHILHWGIWSGGNQLQNRRGSSVLPALIFTVYMYVLYIFDLSWGKGERGKGEGGKGDSAEKCLTGGAPQYVLYVLPVSPEREEAPWCIYTLYTRGGGRADINCKSIYSSTLCARRIPEMYVCTYV